MSAVAALAPGPGANGRSSAQPRCGEVIEGTASCDLLLIPATRSERLPRSVAQTPPACSPSSARRRAAEEGGR